MKTTAPVNESLCYAIPLIYWYDVFFNSLYKMLSKTPINVHVK